MLQRNAALLRQPLRVAPCLLLAPHMLPLQLLVAMMSVMCLLLLRLLPLLPPPLHAVRAPVSRAPVLGSSLDTEAARSRHQQGSPTVLAGRLQRHLKRARARLLPRVATAAAVPVRCQE